MTAPPAESTRDALAREIYEVMLARVLAAEDEAIRSAAARSTWLGEPERLRDDWRAVADVVLNRFQVAELAYVAGGLESLLRSQRGGQLAPASVSHQLERLARLMQHVLEHARVLRFDLGAGGEANGGRA